MQLGPGIRRLFRRPMNPRNVEHDVDDELAFHLETRIEALVASGHSRQTAHAAALREFGDVVAARAELAAIDRGRARRIRRGDWWGGVLQDSRFAIRALRRQPSFLAVAVLTLALGIGANAAIFSVVNAVLVRPLPYPDPERLVSIWPTGSMMPGIFAQVRDANRSFQPIAGYSAGRAVSVLATGEPARLTRSEVTSRFFDVLGVRALHGRTFRPDEDQPGRDRLVVLAHPVWRQRFGGDPSIVGRAISVDGTSRVVVGVMPPGFAFPSPSIDLWVPIEMDPAKIGNYWGTGHLNIIARLRPGVTREQAEHDAATLVDRARSSFPWRMPDEWGKDVTVVPLARKVIGDVAPTLLVLFGAVGVVLLIACVNVANLFLGRAAAREREMAIRASLGAGRRRIVRQLLTESVVLAALGAVAGLGLAGYGVRALVGFLPAGMPRVGEIGIDVNVLAFTLATTVLTGIAFGLAPALRLSRASLYSALGSARGASGGVERRRISRSLAIAQIALGVVLVVGAGLLIKSFWRLQQVELGFRAEQVVTATIPHPSFVSDTTPRARAFYNSVLERVRALPGVKTVAVASVLPFGGAGSMESSFATDVEAHPVAPGESVPMVVRTVVSPDYFDAMGIPLLRGRTLASTDHASAPTVAVIDELTARRLWPTENPIGQRFRPVWLEPWITVVGVVGNVKRDSLSSPGEVGVYLSMEQAGGFNFPGQMSLLVRADESVDALAPQIRAVVGSVDPNVPVSGIRRVSDLVSASAARPRFTMLLLGVFAAVAVGLGGVGIYGVVAYAVARRTREIGVRMALGARTADVLRMVLAEGGTLAAAGVVLGLLGALGTSRVLARFLYGITPTDATVFATVPLLLAAVALAACVVPARRAARVDPAVALRAD